MEVGQTPQSEDHASHFYERFLFVLRNAPSLLPAFMLPIGVLAHMGLTDNRFYVGWMSFLTIAGTYLLASTIYLVYKWHHKGHASKPIEIFFAVVFHALVILFINFVSGFLGAFLAVWIVLMVNSELRFGTKGFLGSFLGLCITAVSVLTLHTQLSASEAAVVLQGVLVITIVAFVLARVRALTDRERMALVKTRADESYQRERLLALVNNMGDAVIATDEQGLIKLYNSSMLSLLDTNADLKERRVDDVLQLLDKDNRRYSMLDEAMQKRTMFTRSDLQIRIPGDESMKVYMNVAPVQPGYQSHAERGYIVILRDITKEKTLEEERDEFVSVVSHELRTPVTIAEGNLSNVELMFERGAEKSVLIKAAKDAHEQIVYLSKLVNDLSTLAKAERGTGGQAEPINLNDLLGEMHKNYSPQAQAKKLSLNLDIAPGLPVVTANKLYLQEVLQNLITNAIKYTQTGSVTIKAHVEGDSVALDVIDTGIGISKSDQEHVFEKFYRSEDYRTRESSGTGLGLYVVKKLAEKQGFRIIMDSRLNHGSTFTLVIPIKPPSQAVATPPQTQAAKPSPAPASTPAQPQSA